MNALSKFQITTKKRGRPPKPTDIDRRVLYVVEKKGMKVNRKRKLTDLSEQGGDIEDAEDKTINDDESTNRAEDNQEAISGREEVTKARAEATEVQEEVTKEQEIVAEARKDVAESQDEHFGDQREVVIDQGAGRGSNDLEIEQINLNRANEMKYSEVSTDCIYITFT